MADGPLSRGSAVAALVRGTRLLLIAQLMAAVVALSVTGYVLSKLGPLIKERDQVRTEIAISREERSRLQESTAALQLEVDTLRSTLAKSRLTTQHVRNALVAYHSRRYKEAISYYDEALSLDPENPWILDLKSYSQFMNNDIAGAIGSIELTLKLESSYVYGFTELSRYQCAAKDFSGALRTARRALELNGSGAGDLYLKLIADDGQFRRLCAEVIPKMREGIDALPKKNPRERRQH